MVYHYSVVRFVPDPARGECVNLGVIAGDDENGDWELRLISNLRRAKAIDDLGNLPGALSFVGKLEASVEATEHVYLEADVEPMSSSLLRRLSAEMRNIVQLTEPAPLVADTAAGALDLVFQEVLVDLAARRFRFEKKHRAVSSTRRSYRRFGIPPEAIEQRVQILAGPYEHGFDFAVHNGEVVQLVQCWSFQLPNQMDLAEEVKAWAWVAHELRGRGGELILAFGKRPIPRNLDIAAVYIPPQGPPEEAAAFSEATAAFEEIGVLAVTPEGASEVAANAAKQLGLPLEPSPG